MNRKIYYWKLRSVELQLGEKTLIMGILNVTPDSFSDGGRFSDPDRAYARALELEEEGADILDIGAESTSPGSQRVSAEEEWRRLAPVLKKLRDKLTIPISLDTYKAETAERAFEYGIEIVNDPSGLTFDADLAKTVSNANAGLVLNHMRGTPETWAKLPPLPDMIGSVARDLEATINRARRAGVDRNRIAIDPGLGFGKRREQNSEILAHLRQLAALDYPILTGPSRKSFLAQAVSAQVGEPDTLYATAAAVAISIMNGAHIVRVHDVKEMRAVCQIADEVARAADAKEAKEAAQAAQQAAERPVPRRTLREADERPRSVKPPMAKRAPQVELPVEATQHAEEREVQPEVEAAAADQTVGQEAAEEMPAAQPDERHEAPEVQVSPENEPAPAPRREIRKEVQREARKEAGKESRPAAKPYADRPLRRDFSDRPPKRDFGDRPPPRDSGGSRPPGDRPPRRDFGSSRPPAGDRPPRRDFGSSRPPTGDRPPRRDFGGSRPPTGDRPPRRDSGGGRPPGGERPPRRDFGDRPPRRDFGGSKPPGGDRPPRRDAGPPPRGKAPGGGGSRPPSRPFRKRP
jgi:dihydropteroate synthase